MPEKNFKILLVDDEPDLAELLEFEFDGKGFETKVVTSGEEALSALDSFQPDAVITDFRMPGVGGKEVIEKVRAKFQDSVICCFAMGDRADVSDDELDSLGVRDVFVKPYDLSEVSEIVEDRLNSR